MYDELFAAWKAETEGSEIISLPSDFYMRILAYLRSLGEANTALKEKNVKTNLLSHEAANAKRMVNELISIRYSKLVMQIIAGQKVSTENLTTEEASLFSRISPSTDDYNNFVTALLSGQAITLCEAPVLKSVESVKVEVPKIGAVPSPKVESVPQAEPDLVSAPSGKYVVVRFLKPVPSIIGVDMKSYGPFLVEDVASVPELNARILVKQSLAKLVDLV